MSLHPFSLPLLSPFSPTVLLSLGLLSVSPTVLADLNAPAAPTAPGSAMHSLKDVCDRLDSGAAGSKRTGGFTEPLSGPADTPCSIDDVMQKAPELNAAQGAAAAEVAKDKTFWGLTADGWGLQTGTREAQATKTLSADSKTVEAGVYEATTLDAVDTDLAAANIKKDVEIFGVTGTAETATYPAPVAATGQTTSNATGDDGNTKIGKTVTGDRFTVNQTNGANDGTVTDNLTGLIWLKNANCNDDAIGGVTFSSGKLNWQDSLKFSAALSGGSCGLSDSSSAGDWRLPNIKELQSLVDFSNTNPALPTGTVHLFSSVQASNYWSSTTYAVNTSGAWRLNLSNGYVDVVGKTFDFYVWPVRGGQ